MEQKRTTGRGKWTWAAAALVAAASVLPYAGTLRYPFLHDDQWAVVNNPTVTSGLNIARIVLTNAWGNDPEYMHIVSYRPLSVLTLALTHALAALDPLPYRLTNLALHATCSLFLLAMLLRLGVALRSAVLPVTWFALHPVHAEAILFVVNREEMLCAVFWLAALHLAVGRSALVPPERRRTWSLASLAALAALTALALLSKESGVMIPFAVAAVGLLWPAALTRLRAVLAPFLVGLAGVVGYLILRVMVLGRLGPAAIPWQDNPLVLVSAPERLAGALAVFYEAFRLLLAPVDLSVDYGYDALHLPGPDLAPRALAGAAIVAVLLAAALLSVRKRRPLPLLGLLVLALSWAPVSHIALPATILMADRLLFLPSAGLALMLAGLLDALASTRFPRRLAFGACLALCVVWTGFFLAITADRAGDFRDAETLFASSLRNRPGSTRLHNNLGLALLHDHRPVEAEAHFRLALAIDPTNAEAHNNLGLLLAGIGRPGSAASEFAEALRIRPNMRAAAHNLCLLLLRTGHAEHADPACERARELGAPVVESQAPPAP